MLDAPRERIGAWIRRRREERGWSQEALGDRVSLSQPMIAKLERGGSAVDFERWLKLCEVFGVREERALAEIRAIEGAAGAA